MRLISTLKDQKQGITLSSFLKSKGIDNQLELISNQDWGSDQYGEAACKIWVIDEEKTEQAEKWIELFNQNPENAIFKDVAITPLIIDRHEPLIHTQKSNKSKAYTFPPKKNYLKTKGTITFYFLLLCSLLFFIDSMTAPSVYVLPKNLPYTALLSSPIKRDFLYDYPQAYVILNKLIDRYGLEAVQSPETLPKEGQYLLKQYYHAASWQGFYELLLLKYQHPEVTLEPHAPLFEKISEGEIWRLFTPSLLHSDILHLLFNMLWLIMLGQQMEQRLKSRKYVLFILIAGIFSNTCQYLMGGPNFLGFSGILCAMLTFIWVRQYVAPWEGYPLQKSTISFMMVFILAMGAIQLLSFFAEASQQVSLSPGVANTGHLSGALIGALLGRFPFFSWKT